jgi:hypothetical protein
MLRSMPGVAAARTSVPVFRGIQGGIIPSGSSSRGLLAVFAVFCSELSATRIPLSAEILGHFRDWRGTKQQGAAVLLLLFYAVHASAALKLLPTTSIHSLYIIRTRLCQLRENRVVSQCGL